MSQDSSHTPDDHELLRRTHRGDESAFHELTRRHARYLYAIARSLTSGPADAEDVLQETFLASLQANFRGEAQVRTWLVQILVRQAAMLARSRRKRMRQLETLPGQPLDSGPSSPQALVQAKLDLAHMLASVSREHREVIILRELERLSYDQIAEVLKVPRGTVESRLHRARAELRQQFGDYLG